MLKAVIILMLLVPLVTAIECDGCILDNKCIEVGTQRLTREGGYEIYCSENKIIEKAKEKGIPCKNNYECISYYCDNICKNQITEKQPHLVLPITIIVIFLLSMLLILAFKSIKSKPKKQEKQTPLIIRKKEIKSKYDKLEKELQSSFERFKKL